MAGDWIPRCKGLSRKPEVLTIARLTGLSRRVVADTMMEFWEWADSETADGSIPKLTPTDLAIVIPETNETFWLAVVQAGWLRVDASGLAIPNFERWLGKNAKRRLMETRRKAESRLSASDADKKRTTVQDSTEQRGMNSPLTPSCPEPDKPASGPEPSTREVDSAGPAAAAAEEPHDPGTAPVDCNNGAVQGGLFPDAAASLAADDPVLLVFPAVGEGPKEWVLLQSKVQEYAQAFPAVDVLAECRRALQWLNDNPRNRKTARGMTRYLGNWLSRSQDRAQRIPVTTGVVLPVPTESAEERKQRVARERAAMEEEMRSATLPKHRRPPEGP
jgi:hypothetical protein